MSSLVCQVKNFDYLCGKFTKNMTDILKIAEPVKTEFVHCINEFSKTLGSETPLLQSAIEQVLNTKGKRIRPLLLLLTAKACGEVKPVALKYAIVIETLHTATLIHDDVVDETKQRRSIPSLNAIFDNRVAVLTGDFLVADAMQKAADLGNNYVIKVISTVCRELSEGELMQLDNADNHNLDEDNYLKMIRKKTASLISASSEIGAISAGAQPETVTACRLFGEYLGYCYQIKDDIFDYYDDANIGKPTGNDIREGKITLPLLYALNNATDAFEYRKIIDNQDYTPSNVSKLIAFAKQNGGIEYAEKVIGDYKNKAVEIINEVVKNPVRDNLLQLTDYVVARTL